VLILIDKTNLRMVAAAATRKWINLVSYVDYPDIDVVIVDSLEGMTWSVLDKPQMATLYTNMSGQPAPEYGECITQLRSYSESWPNYPKTEAELEREAEAIYAEEQAGVFDNPHDPHLHPENVVQRQAHQAAIQAAEAAHVSPSPAEPSEASQPAPTKPKAEAKAEPAPRQGITKKIWEIADDLLAVTGSVGNIKEFRKTVISRAAAIGANEGTAATQFGKWKASKGL
jgi:hypothetical protein